MNVPDRYEVVITGTKDEPGDYRKTLFLYEISEVIDAVRRYRTDATTARATVTEIVIKPVFLEGE